MTLDRYHGHPDRPHSGCRSRCEQVRDELQRERFPPPDRAAGLAPGAAEQQFLAPRGAGDPTPMRWKVHTELLAVALALAAFAARAQQVVYGPDGAPTVVQRKLYNMTGRWEAGGSFGIAMNNALVDQVGGLFSLTYHPNEWLDVGAEALVNRVSLSTLARNVRADLRPRSPGQVADEFSNDNQLRAGAFAVARIAPIYGKFNLASELRVHFQAFLLTGAGAAQVHRESVNLCADPGTGTCENFQRSDDVAGVGLIGGGFRLYLNQRWSLRTEVRGYLFRSSYKRGNDLTDPSTGTPRRYLAAVAIFGAGLSYMF
jgi:outer membrane beta-barrel protein